MRTSILIILFSLLLNATGFTQKQKKLLTLKQVIQLSKEQSLDAIVAKQRFRADYWEFRSYKAKYLPKFTLNTQFPQFNRSIKKYQNPDGSYSYIEDNYNTTSVNLNMSQNIGLTGGQIFVNSDLQRIDEFGSDHVYSYMSSPVSIGYRQPVLLYNEYKWEKQIEPLKYKEARKTYLSNLESATINGINYFFDLLLAQKNLQIAKSNYANADTLYKISRQRYKIGTIAENELMQMKLSYLNAGADLNETKIDLRAAKIRLRSFLGFNENVDIELISPDSVSTVTIDVDKALKFVRKNNPELINYEQQLLEAERQVAKAKSEKGLNASLFASFGLTQKSDEFQNVYENPQNQESLNIGLEIPLVDWGLGKGKYKMAKSNRELIKTDIKRSEIEFMQNVALKIMKFNLQDDQVEIKKQASKTAQRRFHISKKRFMVGKLDVLDLNDASQEKDIEKRNYISSLRSYWINYFEIRKITLYDFFNQKPIETQFDNIIE
jgi:outer membrane protein TolC